MKRTIIIILAVLILLSAVSVLAYPMVSHYVNEKYQSTICTDYSGEIAKKDEAELSAQWKQANEYNALLQGFTQTALEEAQADYDTLLNPSGNGVMGYVEIPKLDLRLPIYHGTDSKTLELGVGHLLGSSLPTGTKGCHAALTGHSGMANQRMFTDLEQMEEGDIFYLHILDKVFAYEVRNIHVVLPEDTSLLVPEDGKDLCTLITCTPYAVNSHRLLVCGEGVPLEQAEEIAEVQSVSQTSVWREQYLRGILWGVGGALVIVVIFVTVLLIKRRKRRES